MSTAAMQTTNGTNGKGNTLKAFLESPTARAKLAEVASKAMHPEDLIRLALMAASRQPELAKCSQTSILRALLDSAALGVAPGGMMGRGYIVPRMNRSTKEMEACFDPGWRGLVDIARRSGKVRRIEAHAVYETDEFDVDLGDDGKITHRPNLEVDDRGQVIAAYAIAEFADGSKQREFLTRADLNKIRNVSMAKNGPWASWGEEMARKSAVRRLCKYLPYDPILERAMEQADDAETGERTAPSHVEQPSRAKSLAARVRAKVDVVDDMPADDPTTADELTPDREPGEEG